MMQTRHALTVLAVLAFAAAAVPAVQAHGGHDHVVGTVKAVDLTAGTVVVEGRYHKQFTVAINGDTKFLRGTDPAAASDMVVGMRVVIDADTIDKKQVAKEVKLGVMAKEPAADAPAPAPNPANSPSQ